MIVLNVDLKMELMEHKDKREKKMNEIIRIELVLLLKRAIILLEKEKPIKEIKKLTIEEINPEDTGREDIREL